MLDWALVVAANNRSVLNANLLASPEVAEATEVLIEHDSLSTAHAYNSGLRSTTAEIVVFAHQDVYLPRGWLAALRHAIQTVEEFDSNWGVLGAFGYTSEGLGAGSVYCSGNGKLFVTHPARPTRVESLDELLLIVRRSARLLFDTNLPGFHLYGADICLQARLDGRASYAIHTPCIHNTNQILLLPASYWRAYFYMRRKWRAQLPINTPCMQVTRNNLPAARYMLAALPRALTARSLSRTTRVADPELLYRTQLHSTPSPVHDILKQRRTIRET